MQNVGFLMKRLNYVSMQSSVRHKAVCLVGEIENSKLCYLDMKIMSQRNGGDLVNEFAGQVVDLINTIL